MSSSTLVQPPPSTSLPPLASRSFATATRFRSFSHSSFSYLIRLHTLFVLLRPGRQRARPISSRFPILHHSKFTLRLLVFSLARFTYGPQRYVVPEGPRFIEFTFLPPHSGTRRHRLPQHRPDYILVPASDGVCSISLIAVVY